MDHRDGVFTGQEPIGGVWFGFRLQNLMQRAHAYHVTEFHMAEILLLAGNSCPPPKAHLQNLLLLSALSASSVSEQYVRYPWF